MEYKPVLDKHAASVGMKIGDFKYFGMITYVTSRQEVVEFGADTLGRTWKMVWEPQGSDLVNKTELTKPDGTMQKLQHVFTKIDNDAFKAKLYPIAADGSRASEPREQVTLKRQKAVPRRSSMGILPICITGVPPVPAGPRWPWDSWARRPCYCANARPAALKAARTRSGSWSCPNQPSTTAP